MVLFPEIFKVFLDLCGPMFLKDLAPTSKLRKLYFKHQKNSRTIQQIQEFKNHLITDLLAPEHERNGQQKSWMEIIHNHKLGKSGWTLVIFHEEWLALEMLNCFCFFRKDGLQSFLSEI